MNRWGFVREIFKKTIGRWALATIAVLLATGAFVSWRVGGSLVAPNQHPIGDPPAAFPARNVQFTNVYGSTIRGWLAEGEPGKGFVLLLHGIRSDRRSMLGRAIFLNEAGYGVLLIDEQANGESDGTMVGLGYYEARDARAAIDFLRDHYPHEPLAAIGESMGGAACLLGDDPLPVRGLVLEEVYPDLKSAIRNRIRQRVGSLGSAFLTPLLLIQVYPRLGARVDQFRPIDGIKRIGCPVLVIGGMLDTDTPADETRKLFEAAPEPKQLWLIPDIGHWDVYRHKPKEYREKILAFLAATLGGTP